MSGTMTIPLTNGGETIVDEEDYDMLVAMGVWYKSDTGYAVRRYKGVTYRMHRIIANPPKRLFTDHINRDRLDNRRSNLRIVSQAQNAANGSGNGVKTVYEGLPKGITFDYSRGKFMARKYVQKRFNNLEEAKTWQELKQVAKRLQQPTKLNTVQIFMQKSVLKVES